MLDRIRRVMVVVRLADGRPVIWNDIVLGEPELKQLEAWETPAFLILPNGLQRMDARIWSVVRRPGRVHGDSVGNALRAGSTDQGRAH